MKRLILLLLSSLLFVNCSHMIVRTGYTVKKTDYKPCDVIIKKGTQINDTSAIKVGEILITDSGISLICDEQDAMEILKREACALDADFILIKREYEPSIISTCYRCSADFYKYGITDTVSKNQNNVP